MKKNEQFIGICTGISENGLGIVRQNGFCYFVKDALPEEEVEVHITAVKKSYGYGFVTKWLTVSQNRQLPRCSVFSRCGGCHLQHCNYAMQLEIKRQQVMDCFCRIAHLNVPVEACLGMQDPWAYRNKVQIPVEVKEGHVKTGFYRTNSHDIVEYDNCPVQSDLQNKIVKTLKELAERYGCAQDIRHFLIKHAHKTNQVMVVLIVRRYPFSHHKELVEECVRRHKEIRSVIVNINTRKDNVILGNEEITVFGDSRIQEELDGLKFNISSKSFYQINPYQTRVLYHKAIELADLTKNKIVADVYCGTGTIGIFAARYAQKVIGIEIVPSAIEDAKINAKNNDIENIEFLLGDAGYWMTKLAEQHVHIDVAIVDPPRKGLDEKTIQALTVMGISKIVYVSCNPATLARDCARFAELQYCVEIVQPIDLFPQTMHTETVCLLSKLHSAHHIEVEIMMEEPNLMGAENLISTK